ncbi:hypothetical protein ACJX0J_006526, partial [Zea mays]
MKMLALEISENIAVSGTFQIVKALPIMFGDQLRKYYAIIFLTTITCKTIIAEQAET